MLLVLTMAILSILHKFSVVKLNKFILKFSINTKMYVNISLYGDILNSQEMVALYGNNYMKKPHRVHMSPLLCWLTQLDFKNFTINEIRPFYNRPFILYIRLYAPHGVYNNSFFMEFTFYDFLLYHDISILYLYFPKLP